MGPGAGRTCLCAVWCARTAHRLRVPPSTEAHIDQRQESAMLSKPYRVTESTLYCLVLLRILVLM